MDGSPAGLLLLLLLLLLVAAGEAAPACVRPFVAPSVCALFFFFAMARTAVVALLALLRRGGGRLLCCPCDVPSPNKFRLGVSVENGTHCPTVAEISPIPSPCNGTAEPYCTLSITATIRTPACLRQDQRQVSLTRIVLAARHRFEWAMSPLISPVQAATMRS